MAQSKCNNKASCSISTVPGEFFGEPCWGSAKWAKVRTEIVKLLGMVINFVNVAKEFLLIRHKKFTRN